MDLPYFLAYSNLVKFGKSVPSVQICLPRLPRSIALCAQPKANLTGACPVGSENRTGVAPEDRTGVKPIFLFIWGGFTGVLCLHPKLSDFDFL